MTLIAAPLTRSKPAACDCTVHRVVINPLGSILDYGRSARVVPTSLFRALVIRDKGCRHPGCDRPAAWCDAHHIIEWQHGGRTNLANMVCCVDDITG
jgi:hypothetical protein